MTKMSIIFFLLSSFYDNNSIWIIPITIVFIIGTIWLSHWIKNTRKTTSFHQPHRVTPEFRGPRSISSLTSEVLERSIYCNDKFHFESTVALQTLTIFAYFHLTNHLWVPILAQKKIQIILGEDNCVKSKERNVCHIKMCDNKIRLTDIQMDWHMHKAFHSHT